MLEGRGEKVQGEAQLGNVCYQGYISKACAEAMAKRSILAYLCQKK